jgi:hypothetical protein
MIAIEQLLCRFGYATIIYVGGYLEDFGSQSTEPPETKEKSLL